jgi:hypothetical protein
LGDITQPHGTTLKLKFCIHQFGTAQERHPGHGTGRWGVPSFTAGGCVGAVRQMHLLKVQKNVLMATTAAFEKNPQNHDTIVRSSTMSLKGPIEWRSETETADTDKKKPKAEQIDMSKCHWPTGQNPTKFSRLQEVCRLPRRLFCTRPVLNLERHHALVERRCLPQNCGGQNAIPSCWCTGGLLGVRHALF